MTNGTHLQPHRGTLILVLGILSFVCCAICGIFAWVMANNDLRAMAEGRMDPSGEGLTKAGKICGMIAIALTCVGLLVYLALAVLGVAAGMTGG